MNMYDNKDNSDIFGFGNIFSYDNVPAEMTVASRLRHYFPELTFESDRIEEIMTNSPTVKAFKAPQKISLVISIEEIIRKALRDDEINSLSMIIIETWPKSFKYFTQITEKFNHPHNPEFHLKAMIIERKKDNLRLLIFDKSYQIWTMFTEDGRVLSMPRQIARLYYIHYGKYLIYSVQ